MSCKHFLLDHRADVIHWAQASDGLPEIITADGIYSSDFSPIDLHMEPDEAHQDVLQKTTKHIDKCKCIHTFTYHNEQFQYIFPSIKEFNQQYL